MASSVGRAVAILDNLSDDNYKAAVKNSFDNRNATVQRNIVKRLQKKGQKWNKERPMGVSKESESAECPNPSLPACSSKSAAKVEVQTLRQQHFKRHLSINLTELELIIVPFRL